MSLNLNLVPNRNGKTILSKQRLVSLDEYVNETTQATKSTKVMQKGARTKAMGSNLRPRSMHNLTLKDTL